MKEPDTQGRYPLSAKEYEALRTLFGAINALNTDALDKRMATIEHAEEDVNTARGMMQSVCNALLATVPLGKLAVIQKELKDTICTLRIRPVVPDKKTDMVYVDQTAIARLADRAIRLDCMFCEKPIKEGRRCQLYKDLNACFPYDLAEAGDVYCPFAGVTSLTED